MEHAAAAERLKRAVDGAAGHVGRGPAIGRQEPALVGAPCRFWSASGFPFLLVYRSDRDPPSIVRFVHTSQDLPAALAASRGETLA